MEEIRIPRHIAIIMDGNGRWAKRQGMPRIMGHYRGYLSQRKRDLIEFGVRLKFIGRRDRVGKDLKHLMEELERETSRSYRITVVLAIDYGGRDDILRAVNKVLRLEFDRIDEETFTHLLDLGEIPEPDLLIRTAGEKRLSNFLLWHLAYTELFFTDLCWPEFTREELLRAIDDFSRRKRKFGRVLE